MEQLNPVECYLKKQLYYWPTKRARELEAVGFLQLTLAANEKVSWTGGFGIIA